MQHKFAGYPLRPSRQVGESLAGFVSRHFGTNGHWMPMALHNAVSTLYRSEDTSVRTEAWEVICSVTGQTSPHDHQLWIEERFTLPDAAPKHKERYWQRAYADKVRLCPECLTKHGIHLAIWELPLVVACPLHGTILIASCECGKPLTWQGMGPDWTCRCGKKLSTLPSQRAPKSLVHLSQVVALASGQPFTSAGTQPATCIGRDLRQTYDVLFWLQRLVSLIAKTSQSPHGIEKQPGRRTAYLLANWPHGLTVRMLRLLRYRHRHEQNCLLLVLDDASPSKQLLTYLSSAATATTELPADLLQGTQAVGDYLRAPTGTLPSIIFNPRLSRLERQQRMQSLLVWWAELKPWRDEQTSLSAPSRHDQLFRDGIDCKFRTLLINTLVNTARNGVNPQYFRRLAVVWPPSVPLTTDINPAELIAVLDAQLQRISSAHLQYLCEVALSTEELTSAIP